MEVAITSGSQEVLNDLHMGFKLERLYDGCRYLAEAGFRGKVILNYSLNSPNETEDTLLQSVESYKKVASILGEERVFPLMFFLGIQPNTDLEHRLLEEGYLTAGYNPLMLTPTSIRKLLYNPAPLNKIHCQGLPRGLGTETWQPRPASVDRLALPRPHRTRHRYGDMPMQNLTEARSELRTGGAAEFRGNSPVETASASNPPPQPRR